MRRATLLVRPKPEGTSFHPPQPDYTLIAISNLRSTGRYDFKKLTCWIRIIPFMSSGSPIPLYRLSPSHCNLRDSSSDQVASSPSPKYNNDLLLSTTPKIHLLLLHLLCSEVPSFKDAVTLLRVWANQRGYGPSNNAVAGFDGSLSGAWWSFLIAYLIWGDDETALVSVSASAGPSKKKGRRTIGKNLSSYQLFRAVLDFLGKACRT
jgi:U3 small nucleolar RNA-associated protein 22